MIFIAHKNPKPLGIVNGGNNFFNEWLIQKTFGTKITDLK